jgi:hypothetical protein
MRKYFVLAWLLLPLPVVVLHYGRGQEWLARDKAYGFIRQAEAAERKEEWAQADENYRNAEKVARAAGNDMKLRLELARVRTNFRMGEALNAIDGVDKLLDDPAMAKMPIEFQQEARALAGRIHYYAGWVMRLEGAKRELWMEEAELSRQNFRLLSEAGSSAAGANRTADGQADSGSAPAASPATAKLNQQRKEDLESAVQLQRLSLTDLMARPLPEEGRSMSGQGLSEQMAKRRGQRGKQPGQGPGGEEPNSSGAGADRFQPGSGS